MIGESCANCHIGSLQPHRATLTYWAGNQLVLIPNKKAWVCDVCADATLETGPIEQLEALLGVSPDFAASIEQPRSVGLSLESLSLAALRQRNV